MSEFGRLKEIVERLRAKDGCPWDRVQTHETLKAPCIEEAAEVICGINILAETGNAENLQEELGDLLFQKRRGCSRWKTWRGQRPTRW